MKLLRSLQHHSILSCNGGVNFPRPHQQWEVKGDNLATHIDRLMSSVGETTRVRIDGLPIDLVRPATLVSNAATSPTAVHVGSDRKGFGNSMGDSRNEVEAGGSKRRCGLSCPPGPAGLKKLKNDQVAITRHLLNIVNHTTHVLQSHIEANVVIFDIVV